MLYLVVFMEHSLLFLGDSRTLLLFQNWMGIRVSIRPFSV
jgi:hypothetical protein